jgi:hypothetical protein
MNERIRELERQAFDAVWNLDNDPIGPGTHFRPDGFEKKFAELIVKECAQHALDFNNNNQSLPDKVMRGNLYRVQDYIKDRMGVEE